MQTHTLGESTEISHTVPPALPTDDPSTINRFIVINNVFLCPWSWKPSRSLYLWHVARSLLPLSCFNWYLAVKGATVVVVPAAISSETGFSMPFAESPVIQSHRCCLHFFMSQGVTKTHTSMLGVFHRGKVRAAGTFTCLSHAHAVQLSQLIILI